MKLRALARVVRASKKTPTNQGHYSTVTPSWLKRPNPDVSHCHSEPPRPPMISDVPTSENATVKYLVLSIVGILSP